MRLVCLAALISTPAAAPAAFTVSIDRASDTQATLTFTDVTGTEPGSFDAPSPAQRGARVYLAVGGNDATTIALSNNTVATTRGGSPLNLLDSADFTSGIRIPGVAAGTPLLRLSFAPANNAAGDLISGSVTLTLSGGGVFNPAGSAGVVFYGSNNAGVALTNTGTFAIAAAPVTPPAAVPAPPAVVLGLVGVACCGLARRVGVTRRR